MIKKLAVSVCLVLICSIGLFAQGPVQITTTSLPGALINSPYNQALQATGGTAPYTWGAPLGGPAIQIIGSSGLMLSSTGQVFGVPTTTGTFNFTVSVTDNVTTDSRPLSLIVGELFISPSALPNGSAANFYPPVNFSASGGNPPYTWTTINGATPPNMSVTGGGVLSGTPSASGRYTFTVKAADASTPQKIGTKDLSLTIIPTVLTSALVDGAVGVSYNQGLAASQGNGPFTWSVTNAAQLPPGVSLASDGTISGIPSTAGTYPFTVNVSDSLSPPLTGSKTLSITIRPQTLAIQTTSLPVAIATVDYSTQLQASGGVPPYTWTNIGPALPSGLNLSSAGLLSGKPTTVGATTLTFQVTDSFTPATTATRQLQLIVTNVLSIATNSLPNGTVGTQYTPQVLQGSFGSTPYTWSATGLPPGLSLTGDTISGNPNQAGTFNVTVILTDASTPPQTASKGFTVTINAGTLTIQTPSALPDATLNAQYSTTLTATGGVPPYTWSKVTNTLPAGLDLSASGNNAVISGRPTGTGPSTFTIKVTDSFSPPQEVTRLFSITVAADLSITTTTLPHGIQNLAYNQSLQATGGTSPYTWIVSSGTLQQGLSLTTAGALQGSPTEIGSRSITVTLTDSRGKSTSKDYTLVVDPPVSTISLSGVPATVQPTQLSPISLSLASPHPNTLTGKLTMTFTSKAEVPGDDPTSQFSNGLRTVTFTIPANTTAAVFPTTVPLSLQTGTVAGTVQLTASIDNGPQDLPVSTSEIAATPPKITSTTARRTTGGLEVRVIAYAPARRVTTAEFTFDIKVGNTVTHQVVQRSVDAEFSVWYHNTASNASGSSFSYVQPFVVTGDTSTIQSVTVRLSNAQGGTSSEVIPFQ